MSSEIGLSRASQKREFQTSEIHDSVGWLIDSVDHQLHREALVDILLPKLENYILPLFRISGLRFEIEHHLPTRPLRWLAWRILLLGASTAFRSKSWPKTMEIAHNGTDELTSISSFKCANEKVCIVVSLQSYVSVAIKVADSFTKAGLPCCILTTRNIDRQRLERAAPEVRLLRLEEHISAERLEAHTSSVNEQRRNFRENIHNDICDSPRLVRDLYRVCPAQIRYVVTELFPQVLLYRGLAEDLLSVIQPSILLVVRLKRVTENVFASIATESSTPVFVVNHGHLGSSWSPSHFGALERCCTTAFVWNNAQAETLSALYPRLEDHRIQAIGGIQWDEAIRTYQGPNPPSKLAIRDNITQRLSDGARPSESGRFWVTITSDIFVRPVLPGVTKVLVGFFDLSVVVKARPGECENDYRRIATVMGDRLHIVYDDGDIGLLDLLYASDLLITCASTTNLDALAVGTPVLTLAITRSARADERSQLLRRFNLPYTRRLGELKRTISDWSSSEDLRKDWRQNAQIAAKHLLNNYPDGNAGEKIVDTVLKHQPVKGES